MNNSYRITFKDGTFTRVSAPNPSLAVAKLYNQQPNIASVSLIKSYPITVYHDNGKSIFDVHPSLTVGDLLAMLPGTYRVEVSK